MKNFFFDTIICLFGALFCYPIIALVLFLFHRENDVSGMAMFLASVTLSFVLMQNKK